MFSWQVVRSSYLIGRRRRRRRMMELIRENLPNMLVVQNVSVVGFQVVIESTVSVCDIPIMINEWPIILLTLTKAHIH